MGRFIYRIIALSIHIRRLLSVARSPAFASLFSKTPSIHCCPRQDIAAQVDPAAVIELLKFDGLISEHDSGAALTAPLHAELSVFSALLRDFLDNGSTPYWVIGVSELMCIGCHTVIAKAFPDALENHARIGLRPFSVQGTHGKMCKPWVAPDLSFANAQLHFDLNGEIRQYSTDSLMNRLERYAKKRRYPDSEGMSTASFKQQMAEIMQAMRQRSAQ
ncbi:hypothetical protein DFH06DRAFT_1186818 [Mycena polygramma]|nr:hypothetical protein DFH06DRAFT_1186818 [Mycena polygramma]